MKLLAHIHCIRDIILIKLTVKDAEPSSA